MGGGRVAPGRDRLLSQRQLKRLVSHLKGCLPSLGAQETEGLVLRTGFGSIRSVVLGVAGAVAALERGALLASSFSQAPEPFESTPARAGALSRSRRRGRAARHPAPGGASASSPARRYKRAGILPQNGGLNWLLLAALMGAGATAIWLLRHRARAQPQTPVAAPRLRRGLPSRPSLARGAGALAGALGLVALRGAIAKHRSRPRGVDATAKPPALARPVPASAPSATPAPESAADAVAAFQLGGALAEKNDFAGAEAAYRRADAAGHASAATNLGVLLEGRGDFAGAEAAYRRADERGEATGAFNLGAMLLERNDLDGAEDAFRRAAERGDVTAGDGLRAVADQRGASTGGDPEAVLPDPAAGLPDPQAALPQDPPEGAADRKRFRLSRFTRGGAIRGRSGD